MSQKSDPSQTDSLLKSENLKQKLARNRLVQPMNKDLQEVAIVLSEAALDSLIDNEVIKDIPLIGTFVRLARATMSIPDRIFAKKVERFISVIDSIPPEEREQFHNRLETEADLPRKTGEVLVLTLDRIEDLQKAAIIGKLFSHFITGESSLDILRRLLFAVDRAFIDDLLSFPKWALQGPHRVRGGQ